MQSKPIAESKPILSRSLTIYLYVTAICTGASVLIVEILGAKMLSPYVGTSHFVWTAQIAVTLVSLATGYYLGGRLVDRSPQLTPLYSAIFAAGIYLALTSAAVEPLVFQLLRFSHLAVAALLSSMFLFFVPLTLLAAVVPFLIRILARSMMEVGGLAGRLSALSTLGSVAGTLLIGYVLIPFLPNSVTMFATAGLMIGLAAGYFFAWGRTRAIKATALLVASAALAAGLWSSWIARGPHFENAVEVFRCNSNFGLLQVIQNNDATRRFYLNDFLVQNTYEPARKRSLSLFTYMLHDLAVSYSKEIRRVLCVGLGIGIVPRDFANDGAQVDVVEINPAVVPIAQRYFDFPLERVRLFLEDGRYFLNRQTGAEYDVIILDAFLGDSSPSHLLTLEAFQAMRRCLTPQGVLVINCFGDFRPGRDFFIRSVGKTLLAAFGSVRVHVPGNGNVFLVAGARSTLEPLRKTPEDRIPEEERAAVERGLATVLPVDPRLGMMLRDDFNPIEFYDAANREYIRRQLAQFIHAL